MPPVSFCNTAGLGLAIPDLHRLSAEVGMLGKVLCRQTVDGRGRLGERPRKIARLMHLPLTVNYPPFDLKFSSPMSIKIRDAYIADLFIEPLNVRHCIEVAIAGVPVLEDECSLRRMKRDELSAPEWKMELVAKKLSKFSE